MCSNASTHLPPLPALACRVDQVLIAMLPDNNEWYSTHPNAYKPLLVGWIVGADGNDNGAREEGNRDDNGDHGKMAT